jgi:hypothetical protein
MRRRRGNDQAESLAQIREEDAAADQFHQTDPYSRLGYGWLAYFNMLWAYTCLFTLFTILLIPTYYLFVQSDGMNGEHSSFYVNYSLGALGFSGTTCL